MISRAAALPPHLSGTAVSAAADSELSAPERARVLSHLSRCAACRGRLVTEMATKDLVHSLGLGAPTPPSELSRTLLSLGELSPGELGRSASPDPPPVVARTGTGSRPPRPVHHAARFGAARFGAARFGAARFGAARFGAARFGAVGVLSAVGLGLGVAAAAVVPVAPAGTPAASRSSTSQVAGSRSAAVTVPAATGTVPGGVTSPSRVLPAAFSTGAGPVTAVRGAAPVRDSRLSAQGRPGSVQGSAPVVRRAAMVVVVQVVLARLQTLERG